MKEIHNLHEILKKQIVAVSLESDCNHNMFETIRLDFADDSFIKILTPTRSELTEKTKIAVYKSLLKKDSVQFNPLDHEQTK